MKVLCLDMERIHTPTESSTSFTIKWLKLWMCGSMRLTARKEHLPNVLDEATPGEAIKLMDTREIIPIVEQAEDEIIISAPNQPEDNGQPEDNPPNDDNDQQVQKSSSSSSSCCK